MDLVSSRRATARCASGTKKRSARLSNICFEVGCVKRIHGLRELSRDLIQTA